MSTPSMDPVFLGYPAFPIKNAGVISSSVFARGSFVGIKTKTLSTKILPSPHPPKKEKKNKNRWDKNLPLVCMSRNMD